jgi:hypothetical protein
MQMKDKTSFLGRVGIFIPLILIFLTAADSALACPGHTSGVAYRTKSINNASMGRTIITYRAPATYQRCGDNLSNTMGVKYVAVRRSKGYDSGARYVAVRNSTPRVRYIAVNDAPRYVAVRRAPTYVDSGTTYVVARSGYRRGNGVVAYINTRNDIDEEDVRYVAARRKPITTTTTTTTTRYVAVRNVDMDYDDNVRYVAVRREAPRTKYVAVRNVDVDDDEDYVAIRNDVPHAKYADIGDGDIDDDDIAIRNVSHDDHDDIAIRNVSYDDHDDMVMPARHVAKTNYVEYADTAYLDRNASITPEVVGNTTYRHVRVTDNEDIDDLAFLDGGGATTYVADDDIEDACMSMRSVSYVPVENVSTRYVAVDDDLEDYDTDDVTVTRVPTRHIETVSYVPVEDIETVNYVPASNVRYVTTDDDIETVSYVPASNVRYVETDHDDCPMAMSNVSTEPIYVANEAATIVADDDSGLVAGLTSGQRIAQEYGERDGFQDGKEAALEADEYHPENSGDYQKASEGYEDTFGDKDVYKESYREAYLRGYRAGFDSIGAV